MNDCIICSDCGICVEHSHCVCTPTFRKYKANLAIAKEALKYCAIEPGRLDPANNAQWLVALQALEKIKE